jgi:hypothetical protein
MDTNLYRHRPEAANLSGLSCHSETCRSMLSAHIASFLKLIGAQLEETSLGLHSVHHVHNIDCGIANILSLLEPNNEVGHKADQLSLKASSYISRHDLASARVSDGDGNEDADRFRAAQAALAGFRFAVERSRRCLCCRRRLTAVPA